MKRLTMLLRSFVSAAIVAPALLTAVPGCDTSADGPAGLNAGNGASPTTPSSLGTPEAVITASSDSRSKWGVTSWQVWVDTMLPTEMRLLLLGVDAAGTEQVYGEFWLGGSRQMLGKPVLYSLRSSNRSDGPKGIREFEIATDKSAIFSSLDSNHEQALTAGVKEVLTALQRSLSGTATGQSKEVVAYDLVDGPGCLLNSFNILLQVGGNILSCAALFGPPPIDLLGAVGCAWTTVQSGVDAAGYYQTETQLCQQQVRKNPASFHCQDPQAHIASCNGNVQCQCLFLPGCTPL